MLLVAGIAIFAIASLVTVVLIQQMELQSLTSQSLTMSPYTAPVTSTTGPYVYVQYNGWTYTSWGSFRPSVENVLLILWVLVENHGYESVSTGQHSGLNYGGYFHLAIGSRQFDPIDTYLNGVELQQQLPMTDVLNGLSVSGYLAFLIPSNFGSCSLLFQPENGSFNVQYDNLGIVAYSTTTTA